MLLRAVEGRIGLLRRFAGCFRDGRAPERTTHAISEMVAQRVYGLALGYEDLNDHEQLRRDPVWTMLAGRRGLEKPLAGKSRLNRSRGSRRFACWQNRRERLRKSAGRPAPGKRIRRGPGEAQRRLGASGPPSRREHKRDARRRRAGARANQ